ncbi:MAG: ATP-binding protein [Bacillota bacterium]|nr:ATP-binding protein [Bacillota bacterium]
MKPILYMMVGVPGSGKTWFALNKLYRCGNMTYISRDNIRFSKLKDGEDYFAHEKEVYKEFVKCISNALSAGFDVIADATHISRGSRKKLINNISISQDKYDIIPVMVYCSLEKAKERNRLREGREQVPEKTLENMYHRRSYPNKDDGINYLAVMEVNN